MAALCAGSPGAAQPGAHSPFAAVASRVGPSVVSVVTDRSVTGGMVDDTPLRDLSRRFFPQGDDGTGPRLGRTGSGSGFVVSPEGLILTNAHVVANADAVRVRLAGERRERPARLVGSDPNTDLALLQVEAGRTLTPLEFGDSDAILIGDWAVAVGNPFGNLEGSVTVGVISAKGRSDLVIDGGTPRYQDFIQTDASINFGNSGGPLCDLEGRVIGVTTAINAGGQGIGFAIPSNLARRIYLQLRDHGRVVRAWIGIVTTESDPQRAPEPVPAETARGGARVAGIQPDSPAARAGLAVGDVIVEFAGQPVQDEHDLLLRVAEAPVGVETSCAVRRDGASRRLRITPVELPATANRGPGAAGQWLGLEVADASDPSPQVEHLREALGVVPGQGVIVVRLEAAGDAARAGIRPGDVIIAIDGQSIGGLKDYRLARDRAARRYEPMELLIRTGSMERLVRVTPSVAGAEQ